jgi:hypothetical protein
MWRDFHLSLCEKTGYAAIGHLPKMVARPLRKKAYTRAFAVGSGRGMKMHSPVLSTGRDRSSGSREMGPHK